ncbi:MAG TPA: GNAT family N-acetyltransferase [Xanthobacteraceae bacterium]|nr:GNAT family N-acetyltransferase [Xanthobacteraceae bacterium]
MTRSPTRSLPPAKLRRGRLADLDALLALERDFFTADHVISRRSFRNFITSPRSALIVADVDGKVAGCALVNYRQGSRRGRLYTISVGREFQRRGIARQLMAAAEASARRRGCRFMRLEVRADDAGAIALYESSGYARFGRRRRYYDKRIDALRLEKSLARPNPA